ncbi:hypothetical protein [Chromobacterium sp.]|uniref:hypothetical protein n=1 Tax=Chromobacterium sp. TaxID=306190 RepID=UPI0035B06553
MLYISFSLFATLRGANVSIAALEMVDSQSIFFGPISVYSRLHAARLPLQKKAGGIRHPFQILVLNLARDLIFCVQALFCPASPCVMLYPEKEAGNNVNTLIQQGEQRMPCAYRLRLCYLPGESHAPGYLQSLRCSLRQDS